MLAVWYKSPCGRDYLVDPRLFFNAVIGDKEETSFLVREKNDLWYGSTDICSHLMFADDYCLLLLDDVSFGQTEVQKIPCKSFWAVVKGGFIELGMALEAGHETCYGGYVKKEDIDHIVQQLDTAKMFAKTAYACTPYMSNMVDDFSLKIGHFFLIKEGYSEIAFTFTIGGKSFTASHDGKDGSFDLIRHRLEHYIYNLGDCVYDAETGFEIEGDYGNTRVEFKMSSFPTVENVTLENGMSETRCQLRCKVVVKQSDFRDTPVIIGICDTKQVIREIYEALLNVGRCGFRYERNGKANEWCASPMTLYNKVKSNIIEDYISGVETPFDKVQKRQTMVEHVYTICPDYGGVLFDDEERVCSGAEEDDTVGFFDINGKHPDFVVKVPGIYNWQGGFETLTDGVNSTMGKLNSKDWNKRGLLLAQQIRQQLPDKFDLWYAYPFEDEENRGKRAILLYKDCTAMGREEEH